MVEFTYLTTKIKFYCFNLLYTYFLCCFIYYNFLFYIKIYKKNELKNINECILNRQDNIVTSENNNKKVVSNDNKYYSQTHDNN